MAGILDGAPPQWPPSGVLGGIRTPTGGILGGGVDLEAMIRQLQGAQPDSLLTYLGVPGAVNDKIAQTNMARLGGLPAALAQSAISGFTLPHDAMTGQVDPFSDEGIARGRDFAGMVTLGAGAMPAAEGELGMGIRAYHGSPHDFDAFDMSKIGTGEGAQVYGHGLYFAENPEVAAGYRKRLSPGTPDGVKPDEVAIKKHQSEWDAAVVERRAQAGPDGRGDTSAADAKMDDIHSRMVADTMERNPHLTGRQYEVSINADPEHFLDWDKPLSEQPKAVQDAVHASMGDVRPIRLRDGSYGVTRVGPDGSGKVMQDISAATPEEAMTQFGVWLNQGNGQNLYQNIGLANGGYGREVGVPATEALRAAGIKGIRYKDAGSRFSPNWRIWSPKENGTLKWSVGNDTLGGQIQSFDNEAQARAFYKDNAPSEPTHNYVVFDDKIIDILKKYGIAGLTGGAGAALALQPQQKPGT